MGKVALIHPYFRTRSLTELLFSPLGAASLAAQLRRLGVETRIFDCTFWTAGKLRSALKAYQPGIVGIHSMVSMSGNAFRIARMVRAELPACLLVAGGPLPTLYPEMYSREFDAVFRGESDLSFPRFCRDFFACQAGGEGLKRMPLQGYAGLFVRRQGLQVDNPSVHHTESEMDRFPVPDRGDFDHAAYQRAWYAKAGAKTASLMTTYGCPFSCDFCSKPVFGQVLRRRNLDTVFEEVESLLRLGYDSLWIADDSFTLSPSHLEGFCGRMDGRGIPWSCLSRANGIDAAAARRMKRSGCRRVYLGLESGSQATLELMHKNASLEEGISAVGRYHAAGIEVAAFFMVGYPGETESAIEETYRLALALPLDYISFNVPFPLPGSRLYERVSGRDEHKDWSEENEVAFVYRSEFDARRLKRGIAETMEAFARRRKHSPTIPWGPFGSG